ncbi:MSK1 [Candida pseudojiufengensis]|uniref:MSK1 n=1 Tax=Candida pseudojiufengensis TaxID=497109 RepID=UPI0022240EC0|nr:MSK1 [Candida pseudojiufengensis]KAI5959748.1 MSK1 [Candida pseudojiufengensis]
MIRLRQFSFKSKSSLIFRRFNAQSELCQTELDHTYENRKIYIQSDKIKAYYPSISDVRQKYKSSSIISIPQFRCNFENVTFSESEKNRSETSYVLEGRISSIRKAGKGLYFIDVTQDNVEVQIMATNKLMNLNIDEFNEKHNWFKVGDYVSGNGFASRTKSNELTLKLDRPLEILTPCLTNIPNKLKDKGLMNSNRVMNYLVNPSSKRPIIIKSQIIQIIRQFLIKRGFLEVTTPILSHEGTGATANPFVTNFKDQKIQLRVAPELWLKKLIIGGFDKIFEIGSNFRNEGIDNTHNPEFTSCEFYKTYTSLEELMKMTEDLFKEVFQAFSFGDASSLDSYPKYEFIPTLENILGDTLPTDLTSENIMEFYRRNNISIPDIISPTSLLNNLSELFLESLSITKHPNIPVFICNQPETLSPLAKSNLVKGQKISYRFELFINGKEFVNAYEEENDPQEQYKKFKLQQEGKANYGDKESIIPDWEYIKVMNLGLPPTGGWGIGIDRLAMLMSGVERIDNVLPFGNLRDVLKQ